MEILVAEDGVLIEPNHIYLIPPRHEMALINGRLQLNPIDSQQVAAFFPINTFFTSLARELRERAIGIVLSGAGGDGGEGAKEIIQNGGLMLVQDAKSAQFPGMPDTVRNLGFSIRSLSPEEMPAELLAHIERLAAPASETGQEFQTEEQSIVNILKVLEEATEIDFRHYKGETFSRRIKRRMLVNHIDETAVYAKRLETDRTEIEQLYRDLLVDVTQFFRDEEAFNWLEKNVIPEIVQKKEAQGTIRIWIAACASGEEAYSLAILFLEEIQKQKKLISLRIFATDAHEDSIQRASTGKYLPEKVKSIPSKLLDKYFEIDTQLFRVKKSLRKTHRFRSTKPVE